MDKRWSVFAVAGLLYAGTAVVSTTAQTSARNPNGWDLPASADEEKNPVAGDAHAVASGKELFKKNCQRCHGPGGKGDGPDADPDSMQDMDLTVARRANRNPDGIVFYKVWNGRKKPKMPAFKNDLSKDQVWQIVTYVQTLREKTPGL
jgi:mono/diheme cytochrome c family protein